ncbi:cytochrome C oxidase subunit IV family protein [Paracoccus jeotgali]|uniref:cytochrome C oxidase subunit IV family protein n=1 Tax=Paracoccus jeotgali TaxID=2065379 RepID=UPI0028A7D3A0|nr:cytochrome C oxidase subunit IV family protein [Paracoccus jeotgali]
MTLRRAILTWLALGLLLAATVALAHVPMGGTNIVVSLGIAAAKAALIMLVYMKLLRGRPLNRLAAGVLILWLSIMFGLTFTDYLTRPEIVDRTADTPVNPAPRVPDLSVR